MVDARNQVMLAFRGTEVPDELRMRLRTAPAAGVTLFRHLNVESPAQVRRLTADLQAAARARPGEFRETPLLIAADQEGGQLNALGSETTQFAGNMALGAVADPDLAERVGRAIGLELRAIGVTVNYGPVCDLASNPANVGIGIRSFGCDPRAVSELVGATVRGLWWGGVASTLKHFPGVGEATLDTHYELARIDVDVEAFRTLHLAPFRAGIAAGAGLVMSGHAAVPRLTGDSDLPATLSRGVMHHLLRGELGFDGLTISDALDMGALAQDERQVIDAVAGVRAGLDLMLSSPGLNGRRRVEVGLTQGAARGLIDADAIAASARRVESLRASLATCPQPELNVVGCAEHRSLADDLAARSITLVRDDAGILPLRIASGTRIGVFEPIPRDLTPADTTSTVVAGGVASALAGAVEGVSGHVFDRPGEDEIAALRAAAAAYDLLVVGSVAASFDPGGAALVRALVGIGRPTVTVALRTPWDLIEYANASTHVCTYGVLPPTIEALVGCLLGELPFRGRLPVDVTGIARRGDGIQT